MKIISHRVNLIGPKPFLENSPNYIQDALAWEFDVEIDVWLIKKELFLGHDHPKYPISLEFIKNKYFRCHAKNFSALEFMLENNVQCFWHQDDDQTITSSGFIWTHSKTKDLGPRSIACWIDGKGLYPSGCYGVCTDYPLRIDQTA